MLEKCVYTRSSTAAVLRQFQFYVRSHAFTGLEFKPPFELYPLYKKDLYIVKIDYGFLTSWLMLSEFVLVGCDGYLMAFAEIYARHERLEG